MDASKNDHSEIAQDEVELTKGAWEKPEITDFKPVTVARGISYRIGDGFNNLS